jgi:hypothetical protein
MSKTCNGVPISTVFCAENFSGVSTVQLPLPEGALAFSIETESPAGKL